MQGIGGWTEILRGTSPADGARRVLWPKCPTNEGAGNPTDRIWKRKQTLYDGLQACDKAQAIVAHCNSHRSI